MTSKALVKPVEKLKMIINSDSVNQQFKNAMGKHADLFVASLIDIYSTDSGLQKCEPGAVVSEALKAAVLRLPISKGLGFAYIVPYKNVPAFQIGYKGLIQLAMRSGQLAALNGGPVYEGEFKKYDRMTGQVDISGDKTGDQIVGYFVYMELINGFKKSEFWTKEHIIEHAKAKSQSYKNKSSAWWTDFDAMATKTVLRSVLSKYAPMSVEFIAAVAAEDTGPEPEAITPDDPEPAKKQKKAAETKPEPKPETDKDGNEVIDIDSTPVDQHYDGDPGAQEPPY